MNPGEAQEQKKAETVTGLMTVTPGIYDSEDTALVVKKDTEKSTVQLENLSTGKRYTLTYDGATKLLDKYEQPVSLEQIEEGSIVTARFYKPKKLLSYMKTSPDSFNYENLSNYALDTKAGTITIGDTAYNLSNHLVVLSDGTEVEMMDINQVDVLDVWGWHNQVYGINIARGHGYLRLQNDTYFVGGWIEVGQSVIRKITDDMLLVVPEGTATVNVSHNGSSATQEINFPRNEEMAWDLGDVEITVVQKGKIIFTLNPANAKVTIDGKNVDASAPVELEYGLHQMTVTAEGYDTVAQYIKVGEPSASIAVEMDKSTEEQSKEKNSEESTEKEEDKQEEKSSESEESSLAESSSADSTKTTATDTADKTGSSTTASNSSYKVHIDSPEGVEVYLDGNYIGIAPIEFKKEPGNYVITLRKTGYQTRSYTLQIDSEEKDVTYSFSALTKLDS